MRKEEVEKLLKQYYEGSLSPADEELLKEYFTSADIPEGYETEKAIFGYFSNAAPEPSSDFESRIIRSIDAPRKRTLRIIYITSAAAVIISLIGLFFYLDSKREPKDTFDDPQIAYAETIKILYSISARLNVGTEALKPVSKISDIDMQGLGVFNKSMKTLQKEMRNLQPLHEAIQFADTIQTSKKN